MGFVLLVVVPCAAFALVYGLLQEMFGEAAVLLLGAVALFFSLGRQDWAALLNRFKARAVAGDLEGAVLTWRPQAVARSRPMILILLLMPACGYCCLRASSAGFPRYCIFCCWAPLPLSATA